MTEVDLQEVWKSIPQSIRSSHSLRYSFISQ